VRGWTPAWGPIHFDNILLSKTRLFRRISTKQYRGSLVVDRGELQFNRKSTTRAIYCLIQSTHNPLCTTHNTSPWREHISSLKVLRALGSFLLLLSPTEPGFSRNQLLENPFTNIKDQELTIFQSEQSRGRCRL